MVILGLGNPDRKYACTRHNAGKRVIDELLTRKTEEIQNWRSKYFRAWEIKINSHITVVAKPRTFMNESGKAALAINTKFCINPCELLVIYDDINLPLGKLRIRKKGSSGGHKGVQSIIDNLNTENFPRIRIGIGMPANGQNLVEYVLSDFTEEEKNTADEMVKNAADAVELILKEGIEKAMAKINGQNETSLP